MKVACYSRRLGRSRQPRLKTAKSPPAPAVASTSAPQAQSGDPAAQPHTPLAFPNERYWGAVGALAGLIVALLLLAAYFSDRGGGIDEIGLFNPAYVDLHYGKIAYPIYGDFGAMVVHPPLHYKIIAAFMRRGLTYYYAEATPALLMLLFGIVLVVCSPFPATAKMALLCGLAAPTAWLGSPGLELFGMRPENHLNAAWLAGLIALESGRLANWNLKWLFAGAFLVTYASGIHYYAAPALLGVLVYMIWAIVQNSWRRATKPLLAMSAGGLLFGVPYLLLFLIPDWHAIVAMLRTIPREGIWTILQTHIAEYHYLAPRLNGGPWLRLPLTLGIPLVLLSTPILSVFPPIRGLLLASLPLQLFVLLFASHKHAYYFVHEVSIYCIALVAGAAMLADRFLAKLPRQLVLRRVVLTVGAMIVGAGMLLTKWDTKHSAILPEPREQEAEVARAAGKEMLGPNARVGSRLGVWYASGAAHWYNISLNLLWSKLPAQFNVADYASRFDALAEYTHMSDETLNGLNASLSSWYADGALHLGGFFFAQVNSDLNYLLLRGAPSPQVTGFALKQGQLYRFLEDHAGPYTVISLACPVAEAENYREAPFSSLLYLPKGDQAARAIVTALLQPIGSPSYASLHPDCKVVEETHGVLIFVDRRELVEKMRREDQTIRFYRSLSDVPAAAAQNPEYRSQKSEDSGALRARSSF